MASLFGEQGDEKAKGRPVGVAAAALVVLPSGGLRTRSTPNVCKGANCMRKVWVVWGSVCLLALLVTAGLGLGAVKPQTFSLLEVTISFTPTGGLNFESPPKAGQGFITESDFYKWNGAKRGVHLGTLQATCTITKVNGDNFWQFCSGGVLLPGGQITVGGLFATTKLFYVPIVGGTGVYA